MQALALLILLAAGAWLAAVAILMALRPHYCLHLLSRMSASLEAGSWRLNLTEQGLRMLAGAALIVRAPLSKLPALFEIAGWLLVISSILIIVAPIHWHGAYGTWWSNRLNPLMIRILSPVPGFAGSGLIYAAI